VLGWLRPLLVIPESFASARPGRALESALVHELLHVRRKDLRWAAASRVITALWWFHPVAWQVARSASALRELCCDDDAVAWLGRRAPQYRETLLEQAGRLLAGAPSDGRRLAGALGLFATPSSILARLQWLARPRRRRPRLERGVTCLAAATLAFCGWPSAAPDRALTPVPITTTMDDAAMRAAALEVVRAALSSRPPPGCLRLQYAVTCLSRVGAAAPDRADD
jgi:beta-lactamase regulating signal transducer with metallopeptidase domain